MRLIKKISWPIWLVWSFLLIAVGMWLYYLLPKERSFIIIAKTNIIELTTDGSFADPWIFEEAVLCLPPDLSKKTDNLVFPSDGEFPTAEKGFCKSKTSTRRDIRNLEINWPKGVNLRLRKLPGDEIELRVSFSEVQLSKSENVLTSVEISHTEAENPDEEIILLTEGALLRFPATALREQSILVFGGDARIGVPPNSGETELLLGGQYEIRETFWLQKRPFVVARGELVLGDRVTVVNGSNKDAIPVPAEGFVSMQGQESRSDYLNVVFATSPNARSAMRLERAGSSAIYVETTWFERVSSDPVPATLSALAGLLSSLAVIFRPIFDAPSGDNDKRQRKLGASKRNLLRRLKRQKLR